MKRKRNFTLTLTDDNSGQAIKGRFIPYSQGGKFMKVWQDTGWKERLWRLQGNSVKVLNYLMAVATWGNEVPSASNVALALQKKQPLIAKAYAELTKADLLYKRDGSYYLSPYFCWKGNDLQYEEACRGLVSTSPVPLIANTNRE